MKDISKKQFESLYSSKYDKEVINLEDAEERKVIENIVLKIFFQIGILRDFTPNSNYLEKI